MNTHAFLAKFATEKLGRPVSESDYEVLSLEEALYRQIFKEGGRTNPKGYYLNVIMLGLHDDDGKLAVPAKLKSPNDLMRLELATRGQRGHVGVIKRRGEKNVTGWSYV